ASSDILPGVKTAKVLSHDLSRTVSMYPLRARVPGDHPARSVQSKDRVILDAIHQKSEPFFAFLQRLLSHFAPASFLRLTDCLLHRRHERGRQTVLENIIRRAALESFNGNFFPEGACHKNEWRVRAYILGD